jgi:hypothetical protein
MARFQRLEHHELTPALQQIITPDVPPAKRIAMARGVVPLGTKDLLVALYYLSGDRDRLVAKEAQQSLRELPESLTLLGIAGDASPKLLHFIAAQPYDNHHIHEKVALHRNVEDATLAFLAEQTPFASVIEIIGRNEVAVLRQPLILRGLARNRRTPVSVLERLTQFYELEKGHPYRDDLPRETVEAPPPVEAPPLPPPPREGLQLLDDRLHPCVRLPELLSEELNVDELFADDLLEEPEKELDESQRTPMLQRVARMNMVDKLLLAMRGNSEARRLLIRNPNKLIQEAVLDNPRIAVKEVIDVVKERSTPQNVVERVCNNREWTRYYEVTLELCWHPKTPARFIFRALGTLMVKDLKRLSDSRNVPGFTRQQARYMLQRREQRP